MALVNFLKVGTQPMTANPLRSCVLGSTGSIGTSTLDVVARHPERFSMSSR